MTENTIKFYRKFCMPDRQTFTIAPIRELLDRHIKKDQIIIDPFARNNKLATITKI